MYLVLFLHIIKKSDPYQILSSIFDVNIILGMSVTICCINVLLSMLLTLLIYYQYSCDIGHLLMH